VSHTAPTPAPVGARALRVLGIGVVVALLGVLVAMPLVALARGALDQGWSSMAQQLRGADVTTALWHTVLLALIVTSISVALGTALAMAFDRALLRATACWRMALLVPVLVPQFAITLSWTQAYGAGGLSDHLLGLTLPGLYGPFGIGLLLTVDSVPLAWLIVTAAMSVRREPDLARAARSSGAGPWVTFWTIDLPLLRGALTAAAALVFVSSVNSFAVPQVLGSAEGYQTLATLVYQQLTLSVGPEAFGRLSTTALVMVALVLVALSGADRGLGRVGAKQSRYGASGTSETDARGRSSRLVTATVAAYVVLTSAVPLLALALTSLTRAAGLAPVPANWDLAGYRAALSGQAGVALTRSVVLAAAAALLVTAMAAVVVGVGGQSRHRLGTAVTLGFAIPGSALAVGTLVAYGTWLGGSAIIILMAYLAKSWGLGYRVLAGGVDRMAPELGQAGRSSGASPFEVLRTITAPLMTTALATSTGIVMLFALHELTMSSILYGPGTATFAVVVLNQQQLGDIGVSAAMAVILTVPLLMLLGMGSLVVRRREHRLHPLMAELR
jgi:iron(III) transport system permease protein